MSCTKKSGYEVASVKKQTSRLFLITSCVKIMRFTWHFHKKIVPSIYCKNIPFKSYAIKNFNCTYNVDKSKTNFVVVAIETRRRPLGLYHYNINSCALRRYTRAA